jgi:hypothetical protein
MNPTDDEIIALAKAGLAILDDPDLTEEEKAKAILESVFGGENE